MVERPTRRTLVRAVILGLFIGAQLLDGILTYMAVGVRGAGMDQNLLLAWSLGLFGPGATLATSKILLVACGTVLLSRLLGDEPLLSRTPARVPQSWLLQHGAHLD